MEHFLTDHQATIGAASFYGGLAVMAAWELAAGLRLRVAPLLARWFDNLLLACCNLLGVAPLLAALGWSAAVDGFAGHFGLFHLLALPSALQLILSVLLLDLVGYGMHRANHALPLFWRYHRVHHADRDVDVSTSLRFHPFEAVTTALAQGATIALLGVTPGAVILAAGLGAATLILQHGNISLPAGLDRGLRLLVPTPDFHRIHHSTWQPETDSNFGATFSFWDYLFGTYRAAARGGQRGMVLGLEEFNDPRWQNIGKMLLLPFYGGGMQGRMGRLRA